MITSIQFSHGVALMENEVDTSSRNEYDDVTDGLSVKDVGIISIYYTASIPLYYIFSRNKNPSYEGQKDYLFFLPFPHGINRLSKWVSCIYVLKKLFHCFPRWFLSKCGIE